MLSKQAKLYVRITLSYILS